MGFCFFNSVAVAAAHALDAHDLERVAVLDFDVHRGNGTEDIFHGDQRVLSCSTFQYPLFPMGRPEASDNLIRVALPAGAGSTEFRTAVRSRWLPALEEFAPQMIFVSAGFDGHAEDPLAELRLVDEDFRWITETLLDVASRHADGRVVSCLEGGYDLPTLGRCAAIHIRSLAGL